MRQYFLKALRRIRTAGKKKLAKRREAEKRREADEREAMIQNSGFVATEHLR